MMVNIAVLVKQVPASKTVKMDHGGILVREGDLIVNPDDLHALEAAMHVKEKFGGHLTAISMGPLQAKDALYEARAIGADKGILVTDPSLKGSDTWVTTKVLVTCLEKYGPFDLIFAGVEAIDGNTAHVPYQISQAMKIPHITQFQDLNVIKGELQATRIKGHEHQHVKVQLPAIITANKQTNRTRYYDLLRIKHAFDEDVTVVDLEQLGIDGDDVGVKGSPTQMLKISQIVHKRVNKRIEGTDKEISNQLIEYLTRNNLLKT
nr:electron transfer flavoprotein subunit beta/FixA family protein [Candidatus Sigynarchaeota archaeon]